MPATGTQAGREDLRSVRESFWLQGMMAGFPASYFCIKAFSETDLTEDLKTFDVPTLIFTATMTRSSRRSLGDRSSKLVKNATSGLQGRPARHVHDTQRQQHHLLAFLKSDLSHERDHRETTMQINRMTRSVFHRPANEVLSEKGAAWRRSVIAQETRPSRTSSVSFRLRSRTGSSLISPHYCLPDGWGLEIQRTAETSEHETRMFARSGVLSLDGSSVGCRLARAGSSLYRGRKTSLSVPTGVGRRQRLSILQLRKRGISRSSSAGCWPTCA